MDPGLTANGMSDHGEPDRDAIIAKANAIPQADLDLIAVNGHPDLPDPPGLCPRCKQPCRDFTTVSGRDYCDKCGEEVADLNRIHQALVGTGEP